MRGVNYPMLMLMWQDFPRHVPGRKKTTQEMVAERRSRNGQPEMCIRDRLTGCLADGLNKEIWIPEIIEKFYPETSFVSDSRDFSMWTCLLYTSFMACTPGRFQRSAVMSFR